MLQSETSVVERVDGNIKEPVQPYLKQKKKRSFKTDTSSIVIKHHNPSEREIDLSTDNPVAFQTSTRFDDDSAVLLACDSLSSSPRIQENCILAAKIGQLKPILLTSSSGKIYPFLTASNNTSDIWSDEPTGTWSLPTLENSVTEGSSTSTNADDLFKHIVSTSQIYRHIADEEFVELSEQIVQEINKDWVFFPQLRFATSQIFAGCSLLSGSTALLVNCVEPYGRLKSVDAHHERRTSSSIHQSSFPKSKSKYGQIDPEVETYSHEHHNYGYTILLMTEIQFYKRRKGESLSSFNERKKGREKKWEKKSGSWRKKVGDIAEGERLIVPKRVEVAPRNPLIETLFIKLNQSKNEVSLAEVDNEDVDDTLIKDKLTCGKCHKTFNSRSSLVKHLKVKHHIVIVGVKHGRSDQGGRLAYYIHQQQKKADRNSVLRVDDKKLKKQIRKQISYEAVKAKKRAEWAMLESKDLLENLKVLWDTSDGVWRPYFAYVQYIEDVSPIYQYLITKLCLEDSYV
ncbi:uncharacterized protein EV154DRAFT_552151 [Mucor mucedo]|uniref:uncharacterized protein n=1 Tax=Mucor mucedo TaxID=29922 RepID=UPI00221FA4D4|nr:uncharacterized protein EV154DRAFT_552151 [Mucor mucedo]KAI7890589.1 hypothetical protein EV154DRAFT_552151 [Mucor mucedo]